MLSTLTVRASAAPRVREVAGEVETRAEGDELLEVVAVQDQVRVAPLLAAQVMRGQSGLEGQHPAGAISELSVARGIARFDAAQLRGDVTDVRLAKVGGRLRRVVVGVAIGQAEAALHQPEEVHVRIVVVDLDSPAPQDGQAVAVQDGEERQHVVVRGQGPDAVEVGLDGGESARLDRLGVHPRDEVVADEAVEVGLRGPPPRAGGARAGSRDCGGRPRGRRPTTRSPAGSGWRRATRRWRTGRSPHPVRSTDPGRQRSAPCHPPESTGA